jgi:hypothetical protein
MCCLCMAFLLLGPDSRVIRKAPPLLMQMAEELLLFAFVYSLRFSFSARTVRCVFRGGAVASETSLTAAILPLPFSVLTRVYLIDV